MKTEFLPRESITAQDFAARPATVSNRIDENGGVSLDVQGIPFNNVNVYEDKNGAFVVSPAGHKIPKSARKVFAEADYLGPFKGHGEVLK